MLSQNEIDKLLSKLSQDGLQQDENEVNTIKKYDFRMANKFTKDQIKNLHSIYNNFSQLLSTYLSGTLMTVCQVEVISVEERTYLEYTNSLQTPIILAAIDMPPLDGTTLLEISSNITYSIINRLLGGKGGWQESSKSFTDIDLALIEKVILQITGLINESWMKVVEVDAVLNRIETSPQFAQIVAYNEATAIITISVKIGNDSEGVMNVCIPFIALEPIAKKMDKSMWIASKKTIPNQENTKYLKAKLANTRVPVIIKFKEISMPLSEVIDLQPGDVLRLDHKVNDKIQVSVEDIPKFYGKLGMYNNKYAIKITDIVRDEEEKDE